METSCATSGALSPRDVQFDTIVAEISFTQLNIKHRHGLAFEEYRAGRTSLGKVEWGLPRFRALVFDFILVN